MDMDIESGAKWFAEQIKKKKEGAYLTGTRPLRFHIIVPLRGV